MCRCSFGKIRTENGSKDSELLMDGFVYDSGSDEVVGGKRLCRFDVRRAVDGPSICRRAGLPLYRRAGYRQNQDRVRCGSMAMRANCS